MHILCFSIDLPGHLDWGGFLATALALRDRGHEVTWASGSGVAPLVQARGLPFSVLPSSGWRHALPPLPADLSPEARVEARRERGLRVWLNASEVAIALDALRRLAAGMRPDILIVEPYAAAGVLLAERLRLPLVVVGRPALPAASTAGPAADAIARLCADAGVSGDYWDAARGMPRSPHLHIDFFCRSWYADLPEIAPQTIFCGAAAHSSRYPSPPTPHPLVLVTLGSTFSDDEVFFRRAAAALHDAGAASLLVVGRRAPELLVRLAAEPPLASTVTDWVDYAAVFPQLAAIIHHGGVATTHAAAAHGLPQVVVPHAGDQMPQAARVTRAGVGFGVRPAVFTPEVAAQLVASVLYDPVLQAQARTLAQEMSALGGPAAAASAIEALASRPPRS